MSRHACLSREELHAYLVGTLPPESAGSAMAHVETCDACRETLLSLSDADDPLIAMLRMPASEDRFAREPERAQMLARAMTLVGDEACDGGGATLEMPRLGEYLLLRKLGEGGMGTVFKARQTNLDRLVALKVLPRDRSENKTAIARFYREMRAVGRLSHPNIVQAFDAREIDGSPVLVMEYVDGLDLAKLSAAVGPLRVEDACELVRQTAVGLEHAHEQGLVHRDIKPSNLMLSRQGIVKILDLGLALLGASGPGPSEVTAAGSAMGTADYVSPEQVADSHSVDIRSDIYSLGCTLYKLLSGRAPFAGPEFKNDVTKMMAHVHRDPPPLGALRPDLPPGLAEVVARMMAKRPEDRYATPGEVAAAMAPFAQGCDLERLLREAEERLREPVVEPTRSATTGKLSASPHDDTGPSPNLPSPVSGEEPGMRGRVAAGRGVGRRRLGIALAAAAVAASILFGVWVIVRNQRGEEVGRMQVPAGGSYGAVDDQGRPIKGTEATTPSPNGTAPARPGGVPSGTAVGKAPEPISIDLAPEPLDLPAGAPLSKTALVAKPAAIPGVRSWTIETIGHRGACDIAYSPDGRTLATRSADGVVRFWDENGKFLRAIVAHDAPVTGLSWSPDGTMLATASSDATVRLWDAATGRRILVLKGEAEFGPVAWSPAGRFLAAGAQDGALHLWEFSPRETQPGARFAERREGWRPVTQGVAARVLRLHPYMYLAWSVDGKRLTGSSGQTLDVLEIETCQVCATAECWARTKITWSNDGQLLSATDRGIGLSVWNTNTWKPLPGIPSASRLEVACAWSRDGRKLLARDEIGALRLLDVNAGTVLREFPANNPITEKSAGNLEYSPRGDKLALVVGARVRICNAESFASLRVLPGHCTETPCLAWSEDGASLASFGCGTAYELRVWEVASATLRRAADMPGYIIWLAWRPDGKQIAASSPGLQLHDAAKLKLEASMPAPSANPRTVTWSRDGDSLASVPTEHDREGQIVNAAAANEIAKFPAHRNAIAYSHDGKRIAAAAGQDIKVYDAKTGELRETLCSAPAEVFSLAWSPDGTTLVAGCGDHKVYLLDIAQKRFGNGWESHKAVPWAIRWSGDSRTLVSGSDCDTCVWNVQNGELVRTIADDGARGISSDCGQLASRGQSAIRIRELDDGRLVQTLVSLRDQQYAAVAPEGHFKGSPEVEREFVYIALTESGEQITLTPTEFAKKYAWKNDPAKVIPAEPSPPQPAGK